MTKTIVTALLLCGAALTADAAGKFGIGFVLGEPSGLAWRYTIDHGHAVDGVIGFSPFDHFRIHVDYLWAAYPFQTPDLALHYGLGGAVGFGRTEFIARRSGDTYFVRRQDLGFGIRTVIGLTYTIPRSPVDLFFEVAPLFIFSPTGGVGIDAGLGVRFYP